MRHASVSDPDLALARRLARQSQACLRLGSPLYALLLERAAEDLRAGGPAWRVLEGQALPPGSSPGLRLMGAVHRIVLEGRAPRLARHYPTAASASGAAGDDPWPDFRDVLEEHLPELRRRMRDPVQTNEVGRAAGLVGGFALVARETGMPLRALELGASAGLNLRLDHFAYEVGGRLAVRPSSPVRFARPFEEGEPPLDTRFRVADRRGCDLQPLDPTTEEGRLTLLSYVWPDQPHRVRLLAAALEVAREVPAPVDGQSAAGWLARQLSTPGRGTATVVFHSIVLQYLPKWEREAVEDVLREAGERATPTAPLARLALEPAGALTEVRMTLWPGGSEQLLARASYHGPPVHWLA